MQNNYGYEASWANFFFWKGAGGQLIVMLWGTCGHVPKCILPTVVGLLGAPTSNLSSAEEALGGGDIVAGASFSLLFRCP